MSQLLVEAGTNRLMVSAAGGMVENSVEKVFDVTVAEDVITKFLKAEPAIAGYDMLQGNWTAPGAYRIVRFEGGRQWREEITDFVRPYIFGYQLTEISWDLKNICDLAAAQFLFRPVGPRTQVKWYYMFRASDAEAVGPLYEFVSGTWHNWMQSYLDAMSKAINRDVFGP